MLYLQKMIYSSFHIHLLCRYNYTTYKQVGKDISEHSFKFSTPAIRQ